MTDDTFFLPSSGTANRLSSKANSKSCITAKCIPTVEICLSYFSERLPDTSIPVSFAMQLKNNKFTRSCIWSIFSYKVSENKI